MLYKIAALVNGEYIWVSEVIQHEESLPRMYRILRAAYGEVQLKTFEGYDIEQIVTAFLIASAYEKVKFLAAQHLDDTPGKTTKGQGGDHDTPYRYMGPGWGKQESIWCLLLGQVQRGEWQEDLKARATKKKADT